MEKLVSVIVPCYNQGKFLDDSICSLINQTYLNWECIIVNDGSTDNSFSIANRYATIDNRITVINQNNQGLSASRNIGINKSRGQYILPLDADDKIETSYIEKAINVFLNDKDVSIVYCKASFFGKKRGVWELPEYSLERILGSNCIFCSAMFKRTDFLKTNGYNSNMRYGYEDWDFWLSIIELGGNVYRLNDIMFFYRIRSKSMNSSIDEKKGMFLRAQIYKNHKRLFDENYFNPLMSFEYLNVRESIEYKVGKIILRPIRFIYNLL